ncbi:MAG: DUF3090 family protein [Actinomycetota bacterium]|nr:DUF3090 family protein [Actinomycetota bacterium]
MSESFDVHDAGSVTVGTVGEPGQRTFYLQVADASLTLTLKVEKQQVAVLTRALAELLSDLPAPGAIPPAAELAEPAEPAWAVGGMQLSYDHDLDRILVVAEELVDDDDPGAVARVRITREQAASLIQRGEELVEAGRPPCPWCGFPLDPAGHSCPRTNGHRPPTL